MLEPIEEAIELAHAGRKAAARVMLLAILEDDPANEEAWLWLARCAATQIEHSRALRELLRLNPEDKQARRLVLRLARQAVFAATGRDYGLEIDSVRARAPRRWVWVGVVLVLLVAVAASALVLLDVRFLSVAVPEKTISAAQQCTSKVTMLLKALPSRCTALQAGQACLLNPAAEYVLFEGRQGSFDRAGHYLPVADLNNLRLSTYRSEDWGLAVFDPFAGTRLLLIGGATLQNVTGDFRELRLRTERSPAICPEAAPSGLLIQSEEQIRLMVNRIELDVLGTLFIAAQPGELMTFTPLEGLVSVTMRNQPQRVLTGQTGEVFFSESGEVSVNLAIREGSPLSGSETSALLGLAEAAHMRSDFQTTTGSETHLLEAGQTVIVFTDAAGQQHLVTEEGQVFTPTNPLPVEAESIAVGGNQDIHLDDPLALNPALSPDGKLVAYQSSVTGGVHIYLYEVATGETRRLTHDILSGEMQPTWLDDRLYFVSRRTGTPDLFVFEDGQVKHILSGEVHHPKAFQLTADLEVTGTLLSPAGHWINVDAAVNSSLYDVDFISADYGLAVGENNTILRYQGGVWARMEVPRVSGERITLFSVDVLSEDEAWAAGERGVILHYTHGAWNTVESPTEVVLYDIQIPWAVGGAILHLDGGTWRQVDSPADVNLMTVSVEGDKAWAAGQDGVLIHWDGSTWQTQLASITGHISFASRQLVGGEGGLYLFGGNRWMRVPLFNSEIFVEDVAGRWAVGRDGVLLYGDNGRWTAVPKVTFNHLYAVSFGAENDGWAVGENGVLLHYSTEQTAPTPVTGHIGSPALTENWTCYLLEGENLIPYTFIFEPSAEGEPLLATGILPDYTLVLLSGELLTDVPDEFPVPDSAQGGRWLVLREDKVLGSQAVHSPDRIFRLVIGENGRIWGAVFRLDGTETLVGEIPACYYASAK